MCAICGCSGAEHDHHEHEHEHEHEHHHHHHHDHDLVKVEQALLGKNARNAERNRGWLAARGVSALNLVSSPGAGKTTLLERTIRDLGARRPIVVVEGDQATSRDAERIRAAGARAVQINTGTGCHLDAHMVEHALVDLDPPRGGLVLVENVGNLVCPALFDLGESAKVLLASVTEGEDKPIKYPHMFRAASLVVITKLDLAPHVDFDRERFLGYLHDVNPHARVIGVSARTGDGLGDWYGYLDAA